MAFNQIPSSSGGDISSRIVDAKGDIIAATSADVVSRLGVGSDGQVLTASSGQATGLTWTTPAVYGGMTLLASGGIGGSLNITGIPGGYIDLILELKGLRSPNGYNAYISTNINNTNAPGYNTAFYNVNMRGVQNIGVTFNGSSTYYQLCLGSISGHAGAIGLGSVYSGSLGDLRLHYRSYSEGAGLAKTVNYQGFIDAGFLNGSFTTYAWGKDNVGAINSIQVSGMGSGGIYRLYGVK